MNNHLETSKKIYFIGIGGIGMSGLANILLQQGKEITGSDQSSSEITEDFQNNGVKIFIGQKKENITKDIDLVIKTHAIPDNNEELIQAQEYGIPVLDYPEAVGEFSRNYFTICIAGTHGKTTTTAMLTHILMKANLDPTVIIGTKLTELGNKSGHLGTGKYLILESCEYKRSFLNYLPDIVLLTNVDLDHLDYYKNLEDYKSSFSQFLSQLHDEGTVIYNNDDENSSEIVNKLNRESITISQNDRSQNYSLGENKVYEKGIHLGDLMLKIPGLHNRKNALLTFAAARKLHIDSEVIFKALQDFRGSWRRFEQKGYIGNTVVIDDYGHHPTEIQATLQGARERFKEKKILCVFQPHQFSRTKFFFKEFSQAFKAADLVIIPNIYKARDSQADQDSVSSEKLVESLKAAGTKAMFIDGLEKTTEWLKQNHTDFDVIITMGAGDITKVADELTI